MAIFPLRGCVIPWKTTWDKRGSLGVHLYQKDPKLVKKWLSYGHFPPWEVAWFHWEPHGTKGDPLVFIFTKKIQNQSRNGWVTAIFPLRGCVISLRTTGDQRGSLGVHLFQKDPKSVKKWLSYGYFPTERLRDSIENQMGQKGILAHHCFVP